MMFFRQKGNKLKQDDRNNFENAAKEAFEPPFFGERVGDGYSDGYLDNAWWGWKAALKIERERRVKGQV